MQKKQGEKMQTKKDRSFRCLMCENINKKKLYCKVCICKKCGKKIKEIIKR